MGLSDRDYYREDDGPSGFSLGGDRSMVANLIIVNVVLFLIDQFTFSDGSYWLSDHLSDKAGTLVRPWEWWRLLTSGFMHSPHTITHIGFNMFGLFYFGREVEARLGKWEFLRFYLASIIFSSAAWSAVEILRMPTPFFETVSDLFTGVPTFLPEKQAYGASGGVTAVIILFALHNPYRQMMLFGLLPMPAWVMASIYVLFDLFGVAGRPIVSSTPIGYSAHLGGAAFALAYHAMHWRLGQLFPSSDLFSGWKRKLSRRIQAKPALKIHTESVEDEEVDESEVDRILDKINREGSASLTDAERSTLQNASRRYQRKRR